MKKQQYKQRFRPEWLLDDNFKDWLVKLHSTSKSGYCKYCKCDINAKFCDLSRHGKSQKHILAVCNAADDVDTDTPEAADDVDTDTPETSQNIPVCNIVSDATTTVTMVTGDVDQRDIAVVGSKRSQHRRSSTSITVKVESTSPPSSPEVKTIDESFEPEVQSASDNDQDGASDDDDKGSPKKKIKREIKREHLDHSSRINHARKFNDRWLTIPGIRDWIHPLKFDLRYVWCKYCKRKIRSHLSDMRVHSKTRKHQRNMSNRPEIPSELDEGCIETPTVNTSTLGNYVITFPSQKDSSPPEVIVVPIHQDGAVPNDQSKELLIPANIGFIGCGNMAQALMNAFLARGLVEPQLLMASAPSNQNLDKLVTGMRTTNDNNILVKECDIIFICVKPHLLTDMIEGLDPLERDHNPLFISVVTGYDISTLESLLGSLVDAPRVVRTMPNTPCMIGQGCCVYTLGNNTNESDARVVQSMLQSVGYCSKVPEYQIDAVCGLAGSGPAYIYAAIEALADGGVKMGLPRKLSQALAAQMVKGAASMVLETGKHPGQLKDEVCSPGGTTITAMHSLEKNAFRNTLISAVEASANRSKELGGKKN